MSKLLMKHRFEGATSQYVQKILLSVGFLRIIFVLDNIMFAVSWRLTNVNVSLSYRRKN